MPRAAEALPAMLLLCIGAAWYAANVVIGTLSQ
jgi:hypothetical protein